MVISFIAFLILEIIFFCVVSLGTSNLGHYGSLHRIIWIVPEKCALAIQRLAQKIRTEAVQVGVAGVAAAEPLVVALGAVLRELGAVLRELGVVGGAMVRGVIVVAAEMVQGVAEVAHGVENVMAACRNEAQATVVEDPEASSPPPPYFVSILFLSVCFTAHQDHRDLIV